MAAPWNPGHGWRPRTRWGQAGAGPRHLRSGMKGVPEAVCATPDLRATWDPPGHGCLCPTHPRLRPPSTDTGLRPGNRSQRPQEGQHTPAEGLRRAHASPSTRHQTRAPPGAAIHGPSTQTPERVTRREPALPACPEPEWTPRAGLHTGSLPPPGTSDSVPQGPSPRGTPCADTRPPRPDWGLVTRAHTGHHLLPLVRSLIHCGAGLLTPTGQSTPCPQASPPSRKQAGSANIKLTPGRTRANMPEGRAGVLRSGSAGRGRGTGRPSSPRGDPSPLAKAPAQCSAVHGCPTPPSSRPV